jgi:hypothetical protein
MRFILSSIIVGVLPDFIWMQSQAFRENRITVLKFSVFPYLLPVVLVPE